MIQLEPARYSTLKMDVIADLNSLNNFGVESSRCDLTQTSHTLLYTTQISNILIVYNQHLQRHAQYRRESCILRIQAQT